MMYHSILLFSFAAFMVSASKIAIETEVAPEAKDACSGVYCPPLPPYMSCLRYEIPEGKCCPVCLCTDENGISHNEKEYYTVKIQSKCWGCHCTNKNGIKQAECFKQYCPPANCPAHMRELTNDGCCEKCAPRRARTFPPRGGRRPFPARG